MCSVVETIHAQYVSESVKWLSEYWVTFVSVQVENFSCTL
jgi:hypothetical protein